MHLFAILQKIINTNYLEEKRMIYISNLFIVKKNKLVDRRNIYLEKNDISSPIKITKEEVDVIKRIIYNCICKRIAIFIPSTQQIYALINNQDQTKDYLWMTTDLFYYSKTNRYYIIKDKKDKEWMEKFFEKYENQ